MVIDDSSIAGDASIADVERDAGHEQTLDMYW